MKATHILLIFANHFHKTLICSLGHLSSFPPLPVLLPHLLTSLFSPHLALLSSPIPHFLLHLTLFNSFHHHDSSLMFSTPPPQWLSSSSSHCCDGCCLICYHWNVSSQHSLTKFCNRSFTITLRFSIFLSLDHFLTDVIIEEKSISNPLKLSHHPRPHTFLAVQVAVLFVSIEICLLNTLDILCNLYHIAEILSSFHRFPKALSFSRLIHLTFKSVHFILCNHYHFTVTFFFSSSIFLNHKPLSCWCVQYEVSIGAKYHWQYPHLQPSSSMSVRRSGRTTTAVWHSSMGYSALRAVW